MDIGQSKMKSEKVKNVAAHFGSNNKENADILGSQYYKEVIDKIKVFETPDEEEILCQPQEDDNKYV